MLLKKVDPRTDEVLETTEINISEEALNEYMALFCNCEEEDDNPQYVENHMGVNHGWICRKCRKFVQIG